MPRKGSRGFNAAGLGALAAAAATLARRGGGGSRGGRATTRTVRSKPRTVTRLGASRLALYRKKKNPMARRMVRPTIGGVPSFSSWKLSKRPSKRVLAMKRVGASNYWVTNLAAQLKISEGFQNAQTYVFQGLNDLKSIMTAVPGGTTPIPAPRQYVLESSTCEYLITNSSLATLYCDVYDIIRKRDANTNTYTEDPRGAWASGTYQETSGDVTAYQVINSLPTDSRLFKDFFKVAKRTHIALSQGATHRHSINIKANELIDTEVLNSLAGDLAGVSVYTMIVCYGQPVSVPHDEPPATVTTAAGAIDIVRSVRYKFTWVQDVSNNMYVFDNLSSLAGEQVVSLGAGAIVPNAFV